MFQRPQSTRKLQKQSTRQPTLWSWSLYHQLLDYWRNFPLTTSRKVLVVECVRKQQPLSTTGCRRRLWICGFALSRSGTHWLRRSPPPMGGLGMVRYEQSCRWFRLSLSRRNSCPILVDGAANSLVSKGPGFCEHGSCSVLWLILLKGKVLVSLEQKWTYPD